MGWEPVHQYSSRFLTTGSNAFNVTCSTEILRRPRDGDVASRAPNEGKVENEKVNENFFVIFILFFLVRFVAVIDPT
jgi:hypothetical protein